MSTRDAYTDLSKEYIAVRCFPNTSKPLAVELLDDTAPEESEAAWEDFNVAIKATKKVSGLQFSSFKNYLSFCTDRKKSPNDFTAIANPDETVTILVENRDWRPRDIRIIQTSSKQKYFEDAILINVGLILMPPSSVGEVDLEYVGQSHQVPPKIDIGHKEIKRLSEPYRYGQDVIPLKGMLSFGLPKHQPFVAGGLMDFRSKIAITGEPKLGKSLFALNLAYCLATKTTFMDLPIVRTARVLFIQFEVAEERFQERVIAVAEEFRQTSDTNSPLYFRTLNKLHLDSEDGMRQVKRHIAECDPDVVILDPMYKIHSTEENSASETQRLYDNIDDLISEFNISVVIPHHVNKRTDVKGWMRVRGSGQLIAWVDSLISLDRPVMDGAIEATGLLRSGEAFIKSFTFNENFGIEMIGDNTAITVFVTDLILDPSGFSRKQIAQKTATKFKISVGEVNNFFRKLEDEGFVIPT